MKRIRLEGQGGPSVGGPAGVVAQRGKIALLGALALSLGFLALSGTPATAGCDMIRDPDLRRECHAVSRGSSAGCAGIRDPDAREMCRVRARQGRER